MTSPEMKDPITLPREVVEGALEAINKAGGTCLGVAMSGSSHPDPDGALTEVFRSCQEAGNLLAASLRQSLASAPHGGGELREKIARIVDMGAFMDLWEPHHADRAEAQKQRAFEKTDRILAALSQEAEPVAWRHMDDCPSDDSMVLARRADGAMMVWRADILTHNPTPAHLDFQATQWIACDDLNRLTVHPDDRGGEVKG